MGQEEVPSLSICLSIYLSTNNKLWALFENKMRDIFFIKRCFVRSLSLIMFLVGSMRPNNNKKGNLLKYLFYMSMNYLECYTILSKIFYKCLAHIGDIDPSISKGVINLNHNL